jgi:hypothetical protein
VHESPLDPESPIIYVPVVVEEEEDEEPLTTIESYYEEPVAEESCIPVKPADVQTEVIKII